MITELGIDSSAAINLNSVIFNLGFIEGVRIGVMLAPFDNPSSDARLQIRQKGVKHSINLILKLRVFLY
jgi:hypothetical protein